MNNNKASRVLAIILGLLALNLNAGCNFTPSQVVIVASAKACADWAANNSYPQDGQDWPRICLCLDLALHGLTDPSCGNDAGVSSPDLFVPSPDLKSTGFGCEAAIAGCDKYNRDCWVDQKNFSGGKADPVKVLSCQVGKDVVLFGSIVTPNGKAQYSAVLACMAGQCPKGGVITFTDKNGVTINIGFDSSFACINELVRGNNNACANQLATCNDDGDYSVPMAQAPVPGGGGSSSSVMQEVCIDIPAWPSTQPLPGDNGIVLIGDVQVDLAHGGVACQYLPVTTGIVN